LTAANRGLGRAFAEALLARGATTVYATARRPDRIDIPGVVPLRLDITDPESIDAAAAEIGDLDLLINNAGISTDAPLLSPSTENVRREFETNFWGTLNVTRAFAPRLAGGAILNVISALNWYAFAPSSNGYAASKAAEWSLTNGVRLELAEQKTQVTALALAIADTDMMAAHDIPKLPPHEVVSMALDGLEAGKLEVIADTPLPTSRPPSPAIPPSSTPTSPAPCSADTPPLNRGNVQRRRDEVAGTIEGVGRSSYGWSCAGRCNRRQPVGATSPRLRAHRKRGVWGSPPGRYRRPNVAPREPPYHHPRQPVGHPFDQLT
jgi:NAD(P)-dependent dehydrogenase (short-subunit alcohol dehydrogenase family)